MGVEVNDNHSVYEGNSHYVHSFLVLQILFVYTNKVCICKQKCCDYQSKIEVENCRYEVHCLNCTCWGNVMLICICWSLLIQWFIIYIAGYDCVHLQRGYITRQEIYIWYPTYLPRSIWQCKACFISEFWKCWEVSDFSFDLWG